MFPGGDLPSLREILCSQLFLPERLSSGQVRMFRRHRQLRSQSQDEWGRLHGLIDDIRETKGLVRVGVRGLVGQNEFWRFIISTGVLEREGVTSEQELRKGSAVSSFHAIRGEF